MTRHRVVPGAWPRVRTATLESLVGSIYECRVPPAQFSARLERHEELGGGYFRLAFRCAEPRGLDQSVEPGQFVMVRGEWGRDLLAPRAFSVLAAPEADVFSIMLKVYGRGTAALHALRVGETVRVTGPLGRGFPATAAAGAVQILVAGGVGLPPLHLQAMRAAAAGHAGRVELFYGGRDRDDLVLLEDFAAHGIATTLATEDGSVGTRGFVTVPLQERLERARARGEATQVLACGPTPMLAAVRRLVLAAGVPGFLCLEEEMACGFGVCLGCAVPVHGAKPYRYCCSDGPVFPAAEVRW